VALNNRKPNSLEPMQGFDIKKLCYIFAEEI
jgi:hypothetical protein